MPKVSVIIPCYNAMQFLPRTIESLLDQTYKDFEAIVVNDGSTDGIEQWIGALSDPRICLVFQVNRGLSEARNTGLRWALGAYIAFLDADDLWHPRKLEQQVQVLEENLDVGFVYSWVSLIDASDRPLKRVWRTSLEGNVWQRLAEGNFIACGSVPMIRRSCIDTVGWFEPGCLGCEDWDFWLRTAACCSFKVVREILVYYRESSDSISRASNNRTPAGFARIDKSYRHVIDRAFENAPAEFQHLRSRSHALANLRIAWTALKSNKENYEFFKYYKDKAVSHDPEISSLRAYKKLSLAAFFIRLVGIQNYEQLQALCAQKEYK